MRLSYGDTKVLASQLAIDLETAYPGAKEFHLDLRGRWLNHDSGLIYRDAFEQALNQGGPYVERLIALLVAHKLE